MSCDGRLFEWVRICSYYRVLDCFGILCGVRVINAGINLEFAIESATEAIVWDHTTNSALDEEFRATLAAGTECFRFVTTDITGKAHVGFRYFLFAADGNFGSVEDHHEIASVDVRCKYSFVFSTKQVGGLDRDATERLVGGVNDPPVALHLFGFG